VTDDDELRELRKAVFRLEAERDCASLLAKYGFYCDHGEREKWIALFTEDGVIDLLMHYGEDLTQPNPESWRQTRFVGHDGLRELIYSDVAAAIVGRSQHQIGGPPALFRLLDPSTAMMWTYSVVYVKDMRDPRPVVQYQNHAMNRWTFRRLDGHWLISENLRRSMGNPESAMLFEDV
jgi:hypothetical protein